MNTVVINCVINVLSKYRFVFIENFLAEYNMMGHNLKDLHNSSIYLWIVELNSLISQYLGLYFTTNKTICLIDLDKSVCSYLKVISIPTFDEICSKSNYFDSNEINIDDCEEAAAQESIIGVDVPLRKSFSVYGIGNIHNHPIFQNYFFYEDLNFDNFVSSYTVYNDLADFLLGPNPSNIDFAQYLMHLYQVDNLAYIGVMLQLSADFLAMARMQVAAPSKALSGKYNWNQEMIILNYIASRKKADMVASMKAMIGDGVSPGKRKLEHRTCDEIITEKINSTAIAESSTSMTYIPTFLKDGLNYPITKEIVSECLNSADVNANGFAPSYHKLNGVVKSVLRSKNLLPRNSDEFDDISQVVTELIMCFFDNKKQKRALFGVPTSTNYSKRSYDSETIPKNVNMTIDIRNLICDASICILNPVLSNECGVYNISAVDLLGCSLAESPVRGCDNKTIGRAGESIVYQYLLKEAGLAAEVIWLNESSESTAPYDILMKVKCSSSGGVTSHYIEVKSTKFPDKNIFEISLQEIEFMWSISNKLQTRAHVSGGIITTDSYLSTSLPCTSLSSVFDVYRVCNVLSNGKDHSLQIHIVVLKDVYRLLFNKQISMKVAY